MQKGKREAVNNISKVVGATLIIIYIASLIQKALHIILLAFC